MVRQCAPPVFTPVLWVHTGKTGKWGLATLRAKTIKELSDAFKYARMSLPPRNEEDKKVSKTQPERTEKYWEKLLVDDIKLSSMADIERFLIWLHARHLGSGGGAGTLP